MSPISAEERAARSLRMKEMWQKKRAATGELPTDPAVVEAMAKVPMNAVVTASNAITVTNAVPAFNPAQLEASIAVDVDWEHIPMPEGQQFYAQLQTEYQRAGRILNRRSMERTTGYTCFMCKKHFDGPSKYTDFSYIDPVTGLNPRIDCCGELCVIRFNEMQINQRHAKDVARAQQERNG